MSEPADQLLTDVIDAAAQVGEAKERLHASILAAVRGGVRQRDLVNATGWTREYLRRLARADGIPAADRTGRSAS